MLALDTGMRVFLFSESQHCISIRKEKSEFMKEKPTDDPYFFFLCHRQKKKFIRYSRCGRLRRQRQRQRHRQRHQRSPTHLARRRRAAQARVAPVHARVSLNRGRDGLPRVVGGPAEADAARCRRCGRRRFVPRRVHAAVAARRRLAVLARPREQPDGQ